ncbi:VOC family protein [Microbacterium resistens]|uniref:VOC family protein n=1 Tax=Microbacterium resistens TaxID=156977 RepID=A0ABY3RVA9_9MICO|nr:VOC family protein [Microbacterium resistens]MBW1640056.1 VOC family protein [Microbacterium resistens]UGS27205.1 VOC family protein [Microbacterium resistens]
MTAAVQGLDHVQLSVTDLQESIEWYARVLGFRLLDGYGDSALLRLDGGPDLMLWEAMDHRPAQILVNGEPRPVFFLRSERIDEFADRCAREGVGIVSLDDGGFATFLKLRDPSENLIGVLQLASSGL